MQGGTVDEGEVAKFDRMAAQWWDPQGDAAPLAGLRVVDVGCGGGLIAEPMARLGATVTGLDAAETAIAVARAHAEAAGLAIDYRCATAEALADEGARFDVVLALEIVEHVADVDAFLRALARLVAPGGLAILSTINRTPASSSGVRKRRQSCVPGGSQRSTYSAPTMAFRKLADEGARFDVVLALEIVEHVADVDAFLRALARLVAPGGLAILSTINRTPASFLKAIVGAEYVLRWLPPGTHDWRRFLTPDELAAALTRAGLRPVDRAGMVYAPLTGAWRLDPRDLSANYLMTAEAPG